MSESAERCAKPGCYRLRNEQIHTCDCHGSSVDADHDGHHAFVPPTPPPAAQSIPDGVRWNSKHGHYEEEVCLGCNQPSRLRDCGCPAGTAWRRWRPTDMSDWPTDKVHVVLDFDADGVTVTRRPEPDAEPTIKRVDLNAENGGNLAITVAKGVGYVCVIQKWDGRPLPKKTQPPAAQASDPQAEPELKIQYETVTLPSVGVTPQLPETGKEHYERKHSHSKHHYSIDTCSCFAAGFDAAVTLMTARAVK